MRSLRNTTRRSAAADLKVADEGSDQRRAPQSLTSMRVDMFAYNRDLKNYHPNSLTIFDNMMNVDI